MRARGLAGHDAAFTRPRSVVRTRPSPFLWRTISEPEKCMRAAVRTRGDARSDASTSRRSSNPPEPTTPAASKSASSRCIMRVAVRTREDAALERTRERPSSRSSNPPKPAIAVASKVPWHGHSSRQIDPTRVEHGLFTGEIDYGSAQSLLSDGRATTRGNRVDTGRSRRSESDASTSASFGPPRVRHALSCRHSESPLVRVEELKSSRH